MELFEKLVKAWRPEFEGAGHDYILIEQGNIDFKSRLRRLDISKLNEETDPELISLVMTAAIHHGVRACDICSRSCELIGKQSDKRKMSLYTRTLVDILKFRSHYRRVTARVLIALSMAGSDDLVLAAQCGIPHSLKILNMSKDPNHIFDAISEYRAGFPDEDSQEKLSSVVCEFGDYLYASCP